MLNKNSIPTGILVALIFPAIAFITEYFLKSNSYILNRPAVPYFIAIALNLLVLRFCLKKELAETVKGVIVTTFLFMVLLFIFKIHPIR